jgi:hypothetical protein
MSLPKRDPNFTMAQLQEVGAELLASALKYWEASHKAGIYGAVIWVESPEGLVIVTRGEYRETLLRNIEFVGPARSFGAAGDKEERE